MKKQLIIIFLLFLYLSSGSQTTIKTIMPCTDAIAQNADGKWIKTTDLGSTSSKECNDRQNAIHELVLKIYPEPKGVDAAWHRSVGISYFGAKRKYYKPDDGNLTFDYLHVPHFLQFSYTAGFFRYQCEYGKTNSMLPGYPGETGTWLNIIANNNIGYSVADDDWTINGLPVITRKPAKYKEDGYEFYYPEPGRNVRGALVYRKGGILPYITVTRKQYLEYCIIYHTKLWNENIKAFEQFPVRSTEEQEKEKNTNLIRLQKQFANDPQKLKANIDYYLAGYKTDQQIKEEKIRDAKKIRDDILKKFTDEIEKSKNEGVLNSPAMIKEMYYAEPIFETDPVYGILLITENPDYIRKDLPKYVPQLFEINLVWNTWAPQEKFAKIFQEKFPTDKLQAMIDK
jgi:hypothetical protein